MSEYHNHEGTITKLTHDTILIDDQEYSIKDFKSKTILSASQAAVGDRVIFNYHCVTREIIFLRMKHPYYRGIGVCPRQYVEDPRDPDEVHDMEMVYGHSFEGM